MDLFEHCRQELALDMEQAIRRRRLYRKFGSNKKAKLAENTWSIEDHRDYLMCGYSDKELNHRLIDRHVIASPAFWSLNGMESKVLIMCFSETYWVKVKKSKAQARAGGKNGRKIPDVYEPKVFTLPLTRLEAVGISRRSGIRSLKTLERLGFIDVVERLTGKPTIYRLSSDYRSLPSDVFGGAKNTPPSQRE